MNLNRQINIWRGDNTPPTDHHLWIFNESLIKIKVDDEWVTLIDSIDVTNKLLELGEKVERLYNSKVNDKLIIDNPVLSGLDLKSKVTGKFSGIKDDDNVSQAVKKLDNMNEIQIIE